MKRQAHPGEAVWRKWVLFGAAVCMSMAVAESAMRMWEKRVAVSDRMDPGLVRHDAELGWVLSPSWRGEHRHADFHVQYSVDGLGLREDPQSPRARRGRLLVVMGDSFTFGLGVNDRETFVSVLNRESSNTWWNYGVPGYSTDQECLSLERDVMRRHPDGVLLVHYLGNDALDNPRAVPLQVRASKPFFNVQSGQLILSNSPVPVDVPPGTAIGGDLVSAVLPSNRKESWLSRWGHRSALARRILAMIPTDSDGVDWGSGLADELVLSDLLVQRARDTARKGAATFVLVLMPGRSWVEAPRSLSAGYQEFLRARILSDARKAGIEVIDLGTGLREEWKNEGARLYHPNEGHLTPRGHEVVAKQLRDWETAFNAGRR